MIVGLCLIAVVATLWCLTALPARPERTSTDPDRVVRGRARERRRAQLRQHPELATTDDLSRLVAEAVGPADADRVLAQAARRGVPTSLMWAWATRYGVPELVLAIDAEVTRRSMERHLGEGSEPDWHAMAVLADLAQDPEALSDELTYPPDLGDWSVGESLPTRDDIDLSGFGKLPPIAGPARLSAPSEHWDPDEVTSVETDDHAAPAEPTADPGHVAAPEQPHRPAAGGDWPLAS